MDPSASSPEVEAKLELPGWLYWQLRKNPDLLGLTAIGEAFERQTNLFYDTATGSLRRAGAVLRARRIAGRAGVEWTHKSGRQRAGSIQTADELSAWGPDADDPLSVVEGLPPVVAARRLAGGALRLEAASLTERSVLRVAAPSGGEVEVALDRLRIQGDPVFVDYELEAESHGAPRADVEALAARLAKHFGLSPSADTKRARLQAYAGCTLGPPRLPPSELPAPLIDVALRRPKPWPLRIAAGGLLGSGAGNVARDAWRYVERLEGISGSVSDLSEGLTPSGPDLSSIWEQADVRVWVGVSVHWRLLRYLASRRESAWQALDGFQRRTVTVDRPELEWRWREADVIALADEPTVDDGDFSTAGPGTPFRPGDLPRVVGAAVWVASEGRASRLTFTARAWPVSLAGERGCPFLVGAPVDQVVEALIEIGYEDASS